MSIQLLDTNVIHQLRSSLVITTLPECIKELVNNAIDANATNIDILLDIERFSVQVNDNGYGIQNMNKIGQRYATSKCHALSDTVKLKTFGFRGEALASITNESLVHIISRHYMSNETLEGFWRDGRIIGGKVSDSKHTRKTIPGTSVIVRDLFYKFPVRRMYLSTYQHVVILESVKRLIMTFALCFNRVSFNLIDSSRNSKIMMVKRSNTSLEIFRQLFGQDITKDIESLDMHEDNINVEGFYSSSGYPNKSHQYIFINNYFVPNNNELYKTVARLFSNSNFVACSKSSNTRKARASIQKYPIYLVKFTCPDWSYYDIHNFLEMITEFPPYPVIRSLLIRFTTEFLRLAGLLVDEISLEVIKKKPKSTASDSSRVSKYVQHSSSTSVCTSDNTLTTYESTSSSIRSDNCISWWDHNQKKMINIDQRTGNSYPCEAQQNSIDRSHLKRAKLNKQQIRTMSTLSDFSLDLPHKLSKSDLKKAQVLGQIDKKYIVIKLNQSLIMMDQHAADERVKLEQMMKPSSLKSTTLESSICIELETSFEYQLVKETCNYFKLWGIHIAMPETSRFFISKSHPNKIYITHLPLLILDRCLANHALLKDLIRDYAYWIKDQDQDTSLNRTCPKGIIEILKSRACRKAIMFNDTLTLDQCKEIVEKLSHCNYPFQCAHGRPSVVPIHPNTQGMHTPKRKINWNNLLKK